MVFKLVRTDSVGANKIMLPVGTHLIGRGKFLDCEDKRISRNHGNIIVNEDSVVIEALHQNPCFWTKKGTTEIQILKKSCKEILQNGDRFGLLPGSYWYELLHVMESDSEATDVSFTQEQNSIEIKQTNSNENLNGEHENNNPNDETIQNSIVISNPDDGAEKKDSDADSELLDFDLNETVDDAGRPESPSLLDQENQQQAAASQLPNETEPNLDTVHDSAEHDEPEAIQSVKTEPPSPSPKRSHSPDSEEGAKKIKTEPDQAKQEVLKQDPGSMAGPSNDQAAAPAPVDGSKAPAPPPRERCLYAASCYRKNPQHKAKFSHPSDSDWGAGARAACPWGAACRKRDPRHFQLHDHPPGARAPPPVRRPNVKISASEESDSEVTQNLIVNEKRRRKPLPKPSPGSDSEEDPFASDGSDDWQPPSDYTESQDY